MRYRRHAVQTRLRRSRLPRLGGEDYGLRGINLFREVQDLAADMARDVVYELKPMIDEGITDLETVASDAAAELLQDPTVRAWIKREGLDRLSALDALADLVFDTLSKQWSTVGY